MATLDEIAQLCQDHDLELAIARGRVEDHCWWRIAAWGGDVRVDQRGTLGPASAMALSELKSQIAR